MLPEHTAHPSLRYQLLGVGVIDEGRWTELRDTFRRMWIAQKDRERERNRGKDVVPTGMSCADTGSAQRCWR